MHLVKLSSINNDFDLQSSVLLDEVTLKRKPMSISVCIWVNVSAWSGG